MGCPVAVLSTHYIRPNKLRRDNAILLKRLFTYLDGSDDRTNIIFNQLVQEDLLSLLASIHSGRISLSNGEILFNPRPDFGERFVNRLRTVNNQPHSSSVQPINENQPDFNNSTIQHVDRRVDSNLSDVLHCFSASQLELIRQLKGIREWNKCLQVSGLLNDLNPALPSLTAETHLSEKVYLRFGSWNLNRFCLKKAEHPGYMEVMCISIMRANFSLILLQEISDPKVADFLCNELNNPSLPHVKRWFNEHPPSVKPCWKAICSTQPTGSLFRGKEYAVFLYNINSGLHISCMNLIEKPPRSGTSLGKSFTRSPCAVSCRIRNCRLILFSVHLKATGLRNSQIGQTLSEVECLGKLVQAFYDTQPSRTRLIIAGDFNLSPNHSMFDVLREQGLRPVLLGEHSTSSGFHKVKSGNVRAYDNAWLSADLSTATEMNSADNIVWTGEAGVITQGLKHPLIPEDHGAGANGFISDHLPIWFDLCVS